MTISDGSTGGYGPGPVSVLPQYQHQGSGSASIRHGLARSKAEGARGCRLVSHPAYYRRFGFEIVTGLFHRGVREEACFALAFGGRMPRGEVESHAAFRAAG